MRLLSLPSSLKRYLSISCSPLCTPVHRPAPVGSKTAAKTLPIGTAYPVWTGIGAIGTVLIGILVFKEPASFWRLFFIFTLIASVIGLRMV